MPRYSKLILLILLLLPTACQQSPEQRAEEAAREQMVQTLGANTDTSTSLLLGTTTSLISRQEAIEIAIRLGSTPQPEIAIVQAPSEATQAEQVTFAEALAKLSPSTTFTTYDPQTPVWIVTVVGVWENAFLLPTPSAPIPPSTPMRYTQLTLVIDAYTGTLLLAGTGE